MINSIAIVGGGSAGWMTAAWLSRFLPDIDITLVEAPEVPIIGVGESTVPPMVQFMTELGMQEQDWMPAAQATYKSSIAFTDFHAKDGRTMWFPFSSPWSVANRPANLHWLYQHMTSKEYEDRFSLYDFCSLVPEICRQNKTVASLPGSTYAYHIDATALGQVLSDGAKHRGVKHVQAYIEQVSQHDNGAIKSLHLQNGQVIEADLYIDCSGFRSMLLGATLDEPFESYGEHLFNDSAMNMAIPFDEESREQEMNSYTQCTGKSAGWIWNIPLYNRIGSGYVYSSRYLDQDQAEREFMDHVTDIYGKKRIADAQPNHLKMRVGCHRRVWVKNCVAIGLSAGFIEPLESTALQVTQSQIKLLAKTLKTRDYNTGDVAVYNRAINDLMHSIRDFIVCHYALTEREDTPYWHDVKNHGVISDALAQKLEMARVTMPAVNNQHLFDTGTGLGGFRFNDGWYYILAGMNHLPLSNDTHRSAQIGVYDKVYANHATQVNQIVTNMEVERSKVASMQSHLQFLQQKLYTKS